METAQLCRSLSSRGGERIPESGRTRSPSLVLFQDWVWFDMGISINGGSPNGWFLREGPMKRDDLGGPRFMEPRYIWYICFVSLNADMCPCSACQEASWVAVCSLHQLRRIREQRWLPPKNTIGQTPAQNLFDSVIRPGSSNIAIQLVHDWKHPNTWPRC